MIDSAPFPVETVPVELASDTL